MSTSMHIGAFFDPATHTVSYIVADPATKAAAIIDLVLDYAPCAGRTSTSPMTSLVDRLHAEGFAPQWILETHVHTDHISATHALRALTGAKIGIGVGTRSWSAD